MTFLIIVSNFEEEIPALKSFLTKRLLLGVGGGRIDETDNNAVDASISHINEENKKEEHSLTSQKSLSTTATSKYQHEIDAAIERGKAKRTTKDQVASQQHKQQNTNTVKIPNAPQQTEMYKQMEDNIARLRSIYERTKQQNDEDEDNDDWPNTHVVAAIQYADYLRHRDTTIHDGGTYQMTSIDVYTSAIQTLERIRRNAITNGKDVRYPENRDVNDTPSSSSSSSLSLLPQSLYSSSYTGLNRELFLDIDTKSIDGALCASYTGLGKVYFMSNMFTLAVSSYDQCLVYDSIYLDSLTYRAQALLILGKYDDAGRDYIHVLQTDTERLFVDAITGLAKILVAKDDAVTGGWDYLVELLNVEIPKRTDAYKKAVSASSTNSNTPGIVKHHADALRRMHHAMFVYHDVKTMNASMAWKHLSKGNKYKLSTIPPFNVNVERERIARTKAVFQKSFFPSGIGSQTHAPIFIIGFVRSGSTLLERILDAHPLIVGTGEDSVFNGRLDYIRNEIVKASVNGDLRVLHETVKRLGDDVVADMKSRWETIDAVTSKREHGDVNDDIDRPYPTRFADKMLTNYNNVGFIHLLFPNALILHVAREPMDTLLSAYKHDFPPGGLDYTSDFTGLAELYHSYRDVMQHWDTVLPGRVTHIRYEDMVTNLPTIAPGIIKAAGVPWDPTVLDFHTKKQAVNTLSTTQVRKGLYSHHFESWKRYEEFLGPLIKLVGSEVKYDLKTTLPTTVTALPSSVSPVIGDDNEFLAIALPQAVVLIRHGEKDVGDDLNKRGRERAQCLANHFKYAHFTHLFAFNDKHSNRPVETITPLSEMTGVLINTSFDRDNVKGLVKHIRELPASAKVLICWEHSYLKKIAEHLGVKKVHKYKSDEYDLQWTVQNGVLTSTNEHC
jgi:tetratricopeptide (TPR) repeat protein